MRSRGGKLEKARTESGHLWPRVKGRVKCTKCQMAIPCTGRCSWLKSNPCPGRPPRAPQLLEPAGEPSDIAVEVDGKKGAE
eukprot:1546096-Heterocapsa_arctica.AAC.1